MYSAFNIVDLNGCENEGNPKILPTLPQAGPLLSEVKIIINNNKVKMLKIGKRKATIVLGIGVGVLRIRPFNYFCAKKRKGG